MFTIVEKTEVRGLEKIDCSIGHLNQCLSDKNLHEAPKFDRFGKHCASGNVLVHTKNGDVFLKFRERDGIASVAEVVD